ncbi:hypothetical protein [uncultured Halomonas sp.]|uniref:hypothetical protein n=1 Tax=uncultured Halomonas sp. TaxID=173971 RepID=UPI0026193493|nr:hypothetical protein [uncultured Halomonas sp.]
MGAGFWILVVLVLGLFALAMWLLYQNEQKSERKQRLAEYIATDEFQPERTLIRCPLASNTVVGLAVNASRTRLCLVSGAQRRYLDARDLIESEVLLDGKSVTKTSRASQFAGAAIGGALFGGVGAIIGGLSGKTTTSVDAKGVKLKVTVNDLQDPVHVIDFIEPTLSGSTSPRDALRKANEWHAMLSAIIKINERNTVNALGEPQPKTLSGQLYQLHELRKSGALTEGEYQKAKARALDTAF